MTESSSVSRTYLLLWLLFIAGRLSLSTLHVMHFCLQNWNTWPPKCGKWYTTCHYWTCCWCNIADWFRWRPSWIFGPVNVDCDK